MVGGGDTAMEEAHYLTRHASKVYLIHRRDAFRASQVMQDRVLHDPKVEVIWNAAVTDIHGTEEPHKVTGLRAHGHERPSRSGTSPSTACSSPSATSPIPTSSRAFSTWTTSATSLVEPGTTKTKVPGVFAAGDVADPIYRQAITAAGLRAAPPRSTPSATSASAYDNY